MTTQVITEYSHKPIRPEAFSLLANLYLRYILKEETCSTSSSLPQSSQSFASPSTAQE